MQKKLLEKFKKILEKEKKNLESQLRTFTVQDRSDKDNWVTVFPKMSVEADVGDNADAADELEEYQNLLPVEHSLELQLRDVNLALKKIEKGTYGICERCKKAISIERLKVIPWARYCLKCEKELKGENAVSAKTNKGKAKTKKRKTRKTKKSSTKKTKRKTSKKKK